MLPDPNDALFEFHTKILGAPVLFRTIRGIEDSLSSFYDSSQNKRVEKYKEGNGFTDFDRDDPRFEPWAKNLLLKVHIRARIIQQARIIG